MQGLASRCQQRRALRGALRVVLNQVVKRAERSRLTAPVCPGLPRIVGHGRSTSFFGLLGIGRPGARWQLVCPGQARRTLACWRGRSMV